MKRDSFGARRTLTVGGAAYDYCSLQALAQALGVTLDRLPFSLRVLLENLLRNERIPGSKEPELELEFKLEWGPTAVPARPP